MPRPATKPVSRYSPGRGRCSNAITTASVAADTVVSSTECVRSREASQPICGISSMLAAATAARLAGISMRQASQTQT